MTLSDRCKQGHLFNEKNTGHHKRGRRCRKCAAMQKRLRYKTNTEFRERKKAIERQRHRDNKELRT